MRGGGEAVYSLERIIFVSKRLDLTMKITTFRYFSILVMLKRVGWEAEGVLKAF